jgi:hypothetical protein
MLITLRLGLLRTKKASSRRQSMRWCDAFGHFGAEKHDRCHWLESACGGTFRCSLATRAAVVWYAVAKSNIAAEVA